MINLSDRYVHHRNLLSKGNTEIGLILTSFSQGLLVWLTLRDAFSIGRRWVILVLLMAVIVNIIVKWAFGWFYNRYHMFDREHAWNTRRNNVFQEWDKKLGKIESDVSNIKEKFYL